MARSLPGCVERAVALLARRPHFSRQLADKLQARGHGAEEVEEAIALLHRQGYLDDSRTARELVGGPLARKGFGPRRLRVELLRRGAPLEVIEEVLAEVTEAGDLSAARAEAGRWLAHGRGGRAALARHLDRKGFSRQSIRELVSEMGVGTRNGEEGDW